MNGLGQELGGLGHARPGNRQVCLRQDDDAAVLDGRDALPVGPRGPDGGHGGNGGSIYFVSDASVHSLAHFRFHPVLKAKKGAPGEGSNKYGKRGSDLRLPVPVGTVVREEGKEGVLFDFVLPGQAYLAAKGGKGGRGNASYATSTHQTPREWEPGRPGEENELVLELKLIKRQVPLKGLTYGPVTPAAGSSVRQEITIQQGIPIEKAREIVKRIKESKLKVQASIQADQVRVSSKSRDALQEVLHLLRNQDFGIDMQFTNYRTN
jgi:hypothetical protein